MGIIEIGIVLVIIFATLGILHYFQALPFSDFLNEKIGFLPKSSNLGSPRKPLVPTPTGIILAKTTPIPVNSDITAISDVPGYSISITNKERLIELLTDWGVYGVDYILPGQRGETKGPLEEIEVRLSNQQQPLFPIQGTNKNVYVSSNISANNKKFTLTIGLSPEIIQTRTGEAGGFITSQLISTLYRIANQTLDAQSQERRENDLTQILKKVGTSEPSFFTVSKM